MIVKIDLTTEQAARAAKSVSGDTAGTQPTVDSLYDLLISRPNGGYLIKKLLLAMYSEAFGKDSEKYKNAETQIIRNTDKLKNFAILSEYVFINGKGASGKIYTPEEESQEENDPEEQPEKKTISAGNDEGREESRTAQYAGNAPTELYAAKGDEPESDSADPCDRYDSAFPDMQDINDDESDAGAGSPPAEEVSDQSTPDPENNDDVPHSNGVPSELEAVTELLQLVTDKGRFADSSLKELGIEFDSSFNNTVYSGFGISRRNDIRITLFSSNAVFDTDMFIITADDIPVIAGSLAASDIPDVFFLTAEKENISFEVLSAGRSFKAVWADKEHHTFYSADFELTCVEFPLSDKILCIDLNSEFATAGISGKDGPSVVNFIDDRNDVSAESYFCPAHVCVREILSDPDTECPAVFSFGHEADRLLAETGYEAPGDFFTGIGRWITSAQDDITVSDGRHKAVIKKKDVLRAYLEYILHTSEMYLGAKFRKLHFTAPVRLKNTVISVIRNEIFTTEDGFSVMGGSESIDRATAVIYRHISGQIISSEREGNALSPGEKRISVIALGDDDAELSSCRYTVSRSDTGYDLDMDIRSENCISSSGGNALTHRIFQFLKIKLAAFFRSLDENTDTAGAPDWLTADNPDSILDSADACLREGRVPDIFDRINSEASRSEDILPTDLSVLPDHVQTETRRQIRRNQRFISILAVHIRNFFFNDKERYTLSLRDICAYAGIPESDICFYIRNTSIPRPALISSKEKYAQIPDISITVRETDALLRPEIYCMLSAVSAGSTLSEGMIDLSGRICGLRLFRETLREFIPGKALREAELRHDMGTEIPELCSLYGSIAYIRDRSYHLIRLHTKQEPQKVLFDITLSRGIPGVMERALFCGEDLSSDNCTVTGDALHIEQFDATPGSIIINICRSTGIRRKEREMNAALSIAQNNMITLEKIEDSYLPSLKEKLSRLSFTGLDRLIVRDNDKSIIDDLLGRIDSIPVSPGRGKLLVFAVPDCEGNGFILFQILKTASDEGSYAYYETGCLSGRFEATADSSFFC